MFIKFIGGSIMVMLGLILFMVGVTAKRVKVESLKAAINMLNL
jgi:hypothetical protein